MLLLCSSHLHASFGMRLCTQAPEIGVSSAFLEGGESRPLVVILLKKKPTAFSRKPKWRKKEPLKLIIMMDINKV